MVRLHPLDRKLLRGLWRLRGQVLAIALVMASGVGVLVMSLTEIEALQETTSAYYERYRFAQLFAQFERAPVYLLDRIRRIPGVKAVEGRVVRVSVLDIAGFEEPVNGLLASLPAGGEPVLNRLALLEGRLPRATATDETVLSQPFATAHRLAPGDRLRALMNGRWRDLTVVGIALSPEYVYTIGPGALMPDDLRFGVLWLNERALQAAYDLKDSFNSVALDVLRGVDGQAVIDQLDELLARYGSTGAYARADQMSNWFLMNEIAQLKTLSGILPVIFLAVAAFLTNMVLTRLIAMERSEIGLLKAFGYSRRAIAWHYVKMVLAIAAVGIALGWFAGFWLGLYNTQTYAKFYHFPFLLYRPGPAPFLIAAAVSLAVAVLGALSAVRQAVRLAPAESMHPPAPPLFNRTRLGSLGLARVLDQPTRIILRQLARWPGRSFLTSAGIAMAVAVMVLSLQWLDAIDHLADVYFVQAQAQDLSVGLVRRRSVAAMRELQRLPGVLSAEPMRAVSAIFRFGHRQQREALRGVPAHQELQRVYDAQSRAVDLPPEGLVMSTMLADLLGARLGDTVTVEVLEERRPVLQIPIVRLFETYIGSPAYMEINALNRLLQEAPSANVVHLRVDATAQADILKRLKTIPQAGSISIKQAAIDTFHATMAQTITIFVSFFVAFSCALAFGVTYNGARIALSERGRELATLRVLGFTRMEISYILMGESGLLTLAALPMGCAIGYGLALLVVRAFKTELYRVPFVIDASTFAWAMIVVVAATAGSALLVRRRLDRLDLIAVLKTRE